jgi:hypothetical protein
MERFSAILAVAPTGVLATCAATMATLAATLAWPLTHY